MKYGTPIHGKDRRSYVLLTIQNCENSGAMLTMLFEDVVFKADNLILKMDSLSVR